MQTSPSYHRVLVGLLAFGQWLCLIGAGVAAAAVGVLVWVDVGLPTWLWWPTLLISVGASLVGPFASAGCVVLKVTLAAADDQPLVPESHQPAGQAVESPSSGHQVADSDRPC